jgi:hypothetical protein
VVVPPYPYSIMEDHHDLPLEDCWYARPQLFFTCHLRPISGSALDGRRGSNVYEINQWLWQFGRSKPQLGGLNVEETAQRQEAAQDDRLRRGLETRRQLKAKGT